jgi:hypothetical protein
MQFKSSDIWIFAQLDLTIGQGALGFLGLPKGESVLGYWHDFVQLSSLGLHAEISGEVALHILKISEGSSSFRNNHGKYRLGKQES